MGAVSEPLFAVDSPTRRRRYLAATLPEWTATDMAAGAKCCRSLHDLSRCDEGEFASGCKNAAIPAASADSAFVDRIRMRDVPPRTRSSHQCGGSTQQHEGLG